VNVAFWLFKFHSAAKITESSSGNGTNQFSMASEMRRFLNNSQHMKSLLQMSRISQSILTY
jgi:hypothetical protein